MHTLIATGVNAEGYREILGVQVTSAEDGAGWLAFFRDLVARGLSGVALVTSDAHPGLVAAIGATLPGAAWQRCRTHYAANLMAVTPKSSWPWVRTLLHSIFDQPDAESVVAQYDRILDALADKLPKWPSTSTPPGPTCWRSPRSPKRSGARSGPTIPRSGSTERSGAAPTSSASSPTAPPSSASSAPCLAEQHDEWTEGRRYLGLDVLARARAALTSTDDQPSPSSHNTGTHRLNCTPKGHAIERTLTPRLWAWPRQQSSRPSGRRALRMLRQPGDFCGERRKAHSYGARGAERLTVSWVVRCCG